MTRKRYLGDGVYVEAEEIGVVLTTENGIETTNRIVLEPEVLVALVRWAVDWSLLPSSLDAARN